MSDADEPKPSVRLVGHAMHHMAGRPCTGGRLAMARLVIEKKVRLERAQERPFVESTQKHRFIDLDFPGHQRANRAFVRRCV